MILSRMASLRKNPKSLLGRVREPLVSARRKKKMLASENPDNGTLSNHEKVHFERERERGSRLLKSFSTLMCFPCGYRFVIL